MKKLIIFAGLFLVFVASKCEDDNGPTDPTSAELQLNFKSVFSDDPLVMYASDYNYEANMDVRFQLFQFYISEVELLIDADPASSGVEVLEVELVNFKNVQSTEAATEGISISIPEISPDIYKGIRFKLGISPDLNNTTPGDYSVDHPLSNHYWSASMGYVFTKIEGNADLDGSGNFEEKLTFHVGTDAMLREITFLTDIDLTSEISSGLDFKVDMQKILVDAAGDFLDFRVTSSDHTSNPEVAAFIADNLKRAISIE